MGHSDAGFQTVVETGGLTSFITPDLDIPAMITKILDDTQKEKHVADSRELLEDQCRSFYTGIIRGIDPEIRLDFRFAEPVEG